MSVFFIAAVVIALWAVVLTVLGLRNERFPGTEGGARVVAAVSCVLAALGIATAVITGHEEDLVRKAEARQTAPPGPPAEVLRVEVDPSGQLKFETKELTTTPGRRTLELTNAAPLEHNIGIVGQGIDIVSNTVPQGRKAKVTADLRPGRYTYYCSVLGHRQGGMEGTLTVR